MAESSAAYLMETLAAGCMPIRQFPRSTMTFTQNGGLFDLDDAFIFDNYGNGAVYNLNGVVFDAKYIANRNGDSSGINQINFKTNGGTLVLNSYGNFTIDLLPKGYISIDGVRATDESQFVLDWETYPNRVGISVIPEPATFVLMGIGPWFCKKNKVDHSKSALKRAGCQRH